MGLRLVWRDLCRCVQGIVAFRRYLRSPDTVDIALGMFEAASSAVMIGRPCRYVVRIANVGEKVQDVQLTVEISSSSPAHSAATPFARFATHCSILPNRATEIAFHYDWRSAVAVMVDKVVSRTDACWAGEVKTQQPYLVSAILADHTGKRLDRLAIYQELRG
jgi:hypothetical protein